MSLRRLAIGNVVKVNQTAKMPSVLGWNPNVRGRIGMVVAGDSNIIGEPQRVNVAFGKCPYGLYTICLSLFINDLEFVGTRGVMDKNGVKIVNGKM